MDDGREPRCFTCRQPVGDPPVLNRLEDGGACPACRDRLLDSLPSLLPTRAPGEKGASGVPSFAPTFVLVEEPGLDDEAEAGADAPEPA